MPGDTSFITSSGDTVRVPESFLRELEEMRRQVAVDESQNPTALFYWLFILTLVLLAAVIIGRPFGLRPFKRWQYKRIKEDASAKLSVHHTRYDALLTAYNGYYRSLSAALRSRFLQRLAEFMATKKFEYMDIPQDEKMPLLISAAAIQLTFGLDKYLLEYFDTIYVLKNDYRYGLYDAPFMGHVSRQGIYLSWNNFLRGYDNDSDADNLGVHEMAHALAYVNFMADSRDDVDDDFKKGFHEFSKTARPIFNDMQNGTVNMLGAYAATNYNEFWAVAVENFFERPSGLKEQMPEFYAALCGLLNQDPLLVDKGIAPEA
jgi:MtfA peptidase